MLWCQIDLDYIATCGQTAAVMVSYNLILCDLCGDKVNGEFFGEPNSSSHGVRGAENYQFLWPPPLVWWFASLLTWCY